MSQKEKSKGWNVFGSIGAEFIRSELRRSSFAPARVRATGSWMDAQGVVHTVNAARIEPDDIDLGRNTECGSMSWDPDNPSGYPVTTDETVDCMTCLVAQARSCL